MKLRLENLGRIKKAEIDIRPLTVFIGKNGTNKTWAAYALYGLVRQLAWSAPNRYIRGTDDFEKKLDEFAGLTIGEIAREGGGTMSIFRQYLEGYTGPFPEVTLSPRMLERLLGVSAETLGDCRAVLDARQDVSEALAARLDLLFRPDGSIERSAYVLADGEEVDVSHYRNSNADTRQLVVAAMRSLAVPNIGTARVLPAERKLLSGGFRGIAARAIRLKDLGVVVDDFADFMLNRGRLRGSGLDLNDLLNPVIGGRLLVLDEELRFLPQGSETQLPLTASASLVGALAGLDTYVRYEAAPGDFLIIDEPEMNAHPEAILGIAEVLAILANAGVNVVVTTHSPYFVDHLENLMDAAALPAKKQALAKERMQLKDERAFLKPERLGVYLFEEHGEHVEVKEALNRKLRGIDWRTFSRVSDRVQNLKVDLAELKGRKSG